MFFAPKNWNISGIYYQRSTYGVSGESWHSGEQKRLMVWYNICTSRAARGLKPIHTRSQIRKTAFFWVDSICPWKFQVRLIEWSIPEVFCLVNQICNRVEPPRFFDLRYFTETPQRRLVAIFGTKWGCKLEFGSRSIRSPKVNFLALTI